MLTTHYLFIYMINNFDWSAIQRGEAAQEALQWFTNDSVSHDSPHPNSCSWIEYWSVCWIDSEASTLNPTNGDIKDVAGPQAMIDEEGSWPAGIVWSDDTTIPASGVGTMSSAYKMIMQTYLIQNHGPYQSGQHVYPFSADRRTVRLSKDLNFVQGTWRKYFKI